METRADGAGLRRPGGQHCPPFGIDFGALSAGHLRSQVDPLQETEHDGPVQVTWHVAPFAHVTEPEVPTVSVHVAWSHWMLALFPAVSVQSLPLAHCALQLSWHVPEQLFASPQLKLQPPLLLPHTLPRAQVAPAWHAQLVPVQTQPGPGHCVDEPPHPTIPESRTSTIISRMEPPG